MVIPVREMTMQTRRGKIAPRMESRALIMVDRIKVGANSRRTTAPRSIMGPVRSTEPRSDPPHSSRIGDVEIGAVEARVHADKTPSHKEGSRGRLLHIKRQ